VKLIRVNCRKCARTWLATPRASERPCAFCGSTRTYIHKGA
jgi:hypothetical protein